MSVAELAPYEFKWPYENEEYALNMFARWLGATSLARLEVERARQSYMDELYLFFGSWYDQHDELFEDVDYYGWGANDTTMLVS